jgi:hypothetical protein
MIINNNMSTSKNIYIDGDKAGFKSKIAVDKFKATVRGMETVDVNVLKEKYIAEGYDLELVETKSLNDDVVEVRFKVGKPEQMVSKTSSKDVYRTRLNMMRKNRTNSEVHNAKNKNVPDDILEAYTKLKKSAGSLPIPEPTEILAKPDEYRTMISMVLENEMMNKLPKSHPYVQYFTLLAQKLGVEKTLPVHTKDYGNELKNSIKEVRGNDIKLDYETDTEEDSSDSEQ